jgi:hypothetical protein
LDFQKQALPLGCLRSEQRRRKLWHASPQLQEPVHPPDAGALFGPERLAQAPAVLLAVSHYNLSQEQLTKKGDETKWPDRTSTASFLFNCQGSGKALFYFLLMCINCTY